MTQQAAETVGRRAGRTRVLVLAADPVSRAGVAGVLRFRGELEMVSIRALNEADRGGDGRPDVAVIVTDQVNAETLARIRSVRRAGPRVVLLARDVDGATILDTVNAGASAIVRRVEATDDRLSEAIRVAASADGSLPDDVASHLLQEVGEVGAAGRTDAVRTSLSSRELRILRLLAEGLSTLEIAREMAYSERTIKQAVHSMTTRLQLRNRSHAVAFAVRKGLI